MKKYWFIENVAIFFQEPMRSVEDKEVSYSNYKITQIGDSIIGARISMVCQPIYTNTLIS